MSFVAAAPSKSDYQDFYGGLQPGDVPLYSIGSASRHLRLPTSTVHRWARGSHEGDQKRVISGGASELLSFNDLIELYVVKALTRGRKVPLTAVRRAVEYASREMKVHRVLLSDDLFAFGDKLLLRHLGDLVDISRSGQLALEKVVGAYMERIDRFPGGLPATLHPDFTSESKVDRRFPVAVSPLIAFGDPTLTGTGIKTSVVSARIDSGETPEEVARDYDVPLELVMNALIFENAA